MAALLVSGCGGARDQSSAGGARSDELPADYIPVPAGRSAAYRLSAVSPAVARRAPIAGLRCAAGAPRSYGVHVELYAHRLVVPVPAGIGIAPPQRRHGAYVLSGACSYPLRTFEPTGVFVVDAGHRLSLGTLFKIWGQPLSRSRLAGFRGRVQAFVGGRAWARAPELIPLTRHAEIVLEIDGAIPPHPAYRFAPHL